MNKIIVVQVDPDLIELVPGFLNNKRKDVEKIAELITTAEYDTLRGLGHKLKGEGGGYGLDLITDIGMSLEDAAMARDFAAVRSCHSQMVEYLEAVEIVAE